MSTPAATTELPPDTIIESNEHPTIEDAVSIADHAASFGPDAERGKETNDADAEPLKPIRPVDRQKRDEGKFANGKQRIKANDAVERINKLTFRAKTAEETLAERNKRISALEGELATLRASGSTQQIKAAEQQVQAAGGDTSDPEPQETDEAFKGDYGLYLRAVAKWEGRQAYRSERAADQQRSQQAAKRQQQQESLKSWAGRVESARGRYQDFDAVALQGDTRIPAGSAVDAWIMEHRAGPDVLYYLQSHPQELDGLLRKPILDQVEDLTLLSQRLLPAQKGQSETSARPVIVTPRPPNVLRTQPQAAGDPVPPTDGSLSIADHRKHFGQKR